MKKKYDNALITKLFDLRKSGKSAKEIAKLTKVPEGSIGYLLQKAKKKNTPKKPIPTFTLPMIPLAPLKTQNVIYSASNTTAPKPTSVTNETIKAVLGSYLPDSMKLTIISAVVR